MFRASITFGYVPQPWRTNKSGSHSKCGQASHFNAKDYRAISLSSFILKILERLVDEHIKKRVLEGNPLHRKHHAYQPGRSIENALLELVGKIEFILDRKEFMLTIL